VRLVEDGGPNWTEKGIFWATVAGVTVTFSAVLVALFGRRWDESRKKPKLRLTAGPDRMASTADSPNVVVRNLSLHNEEDRDTARDVEVFVSADARTRFEYFIAADGDTLNFDDPLSQRSGRSTATVPPGYSRRVPFAVIIPPQSTAVIPPSRPLATTSWAQLAVYPRDKMGDARLYDGVVYSVRVTVTGSNFNAITYRGELEVKSTHEVAEDTSVQHWSLHWKKRLSLSSVAAARRRPASVDASFGRTEWAS
jgi:hypothetical protein